MTRDDDGRLTRYRRSNNGDGGVEKFVELSQQRPKLVTKFARIISFERQTVVLPCEILNLPVDMHVCVSFYSLFYLLNCEKQQQKVLDTLGFLIF